MVEIAEDSFCSLNLLGAAGDGDLVATCDQGCWNLLLDLGQMFMMSAKQKSAAAVVFEGERTAVDLEGCGNGFQACLSRLEGSLKTDRPSAGCEPTGRPPRL